MKVLDYRKFLGRDFHSIVSQILSITARSIWSKWIDIAMPAHRTAGCCEGTRWDHVPHFMLFVQILLNVYSCPSASNSNIYLIGNDSKFKPIV